MSRLVLSLPYGSVATDLLLLNRDDLCRLLNRDYTSTELECTKGFSFRPAGVVACTINLVNTRHLSIYILYFARGNCKVDNCKLAKSVRLLV